MDKGNFLTESFPYPFYNIPILHVKLTGEESRALRYLLLVCHRLNVWIATFPIDESHTSLIFIGL